MKTSKRNKLLGLALTGSFSLFGATNALAAAGDTIGNTATLGYSVGGAVQEVIESASGAGNSNPGAGNGTATDFTEDRLINFTVTEVGGSTTNVAPSGTLRVQTFLVTNDGNGTQDFLFAALNNTGTADPHGGVNDNFDVVSTQVFVETVNAGFNPADDTAIFADEIAPSGTATVYIVSTIPDGTVVSNGDLAVMTLVAQVAEGGAVAADPSIPAQAGLAIVNDSNGNISPAGVYNNGNTAVGAGSITNAGDIVTGVGSEQNVFNDPVGTLDSASNADIARNGQHSADDSYTVATAAITVSKDSVTLWDPVNLNSDPKSFPGSYVTYTVTVANDIAAPASADLTTLGDILVAGLDLDPDFVTNLGPGNPTSAVGFSFEIDTTNTGRPSANTTYCTAATPVDGCVYVGGPGGTLTIDFTAVAGMAAEVGYTAGELKPGESVEITFNVIIQ